MGERFKRIVAMAMAENIQFDLFYSPFDVYFIRDNSVPYEEHHWEIDDVDEEKCLFWSKDTYSSCGMQYETDEDYIHAIKKSMGGK